MKIATTLLAALSLVLLSACSGTPVQTRYYLLRSDTPQQSRDLAPSEDYAMGRVIIASYIDQPGIVLETGAGEIRPAQHHQWAEPMQQGLRNYLRVEVSAALEADVFPAEASAGETLFEVRIDQLHGTADGDALLVAYWWLRRDGELIASFQFSETRPLGRDGYGALASAEKALLRELAQRIAESLQASG